jgi:hypothetical protein
MRIRLVLAIALLATGLGAPTLAAQLPAREVEFVANEDPYEPWDGVHWGLATRIISRAGGIYASKLFDVEFPESYPETPDGFAAFFIAPPSQIAAVNYDVSRLLCFSSDHCRVAMAINNKGRIVGAEHYFFAGWDTYTPYESRIDPQAGTILEFEWLAKPPGYSPVWYEQVIPTAINDGDLIAGWATINPASVGRAPIWWPAPQALPQQLPRISGTDAGPFPARINSAGVIVGNTAGSAPRRAAVWSPTDTGYVLALLGELPGGTSSRAYDVGFFGGIVGSSDDSSGTDVAVIWRLTGVGYTVTPLPVPPDGSCSAATAINTNGDIAGNCTLGDGAERGVVWRKVGGNYELLHELEPLPGHTRSVAYALDNDGQAGGGSGALGAERAVLWPVVVAAPVSVPALSHGALLCLIAGLAGATVSSLRAHR